MTKTRNGSTKAGVAFLDRLARNIVSRVSINDYVKYGHTIEESADVINAAKEKAEKTIKMYKRGLVTEEEATWMITELAMDNA